MINNIILILILFCVLFLMCAVFALGGFFIGIRINLPKNRENPPQEPTSEEQRRKIEQRRHEDNNFLNYDGTEQKDFNA